MKRGLFITVEGLDGSGKTTQIRLLKELLVSMGYEVVLTREPGGTNIGEKVRSIILDPANTDMEPMTEMLLYASARAQLVAKVIRPSLEDGKMVICDRFVDSSIVYQGFGRGIDLKIVEDVNSFALDGIMPDITFFFDICPTAALKRRTAEDMDRIEREQIDFHEKVYSGYKKLAEMYPERIKAINSERPVDEIFKDVRENILFILNKTTTGDI